MKNTISGRQEKTLMKLIVARESDKVIGAHMLGPDAPEIIQGIGLPSRQVPPRQILTRPSVFTRRQQKNLYHATARTQG